MTINHLDLTLSYKRYMRGLGSRFYFKNSPAWFFQYNQFKKDEVIISKSRKITVQLNRILSILDHLFLFFDNKQDQGSKAPSTSPFHQLKMEPSIDRQYFVSIPRVLELQRVLLLEMIFFNLEKLKKLKKKKKILWKKSF